MAYVQSEQRKTTRVSIWDRLEYRFIVGIIFTFCLAVSVTKRAVAAVSSSETHQERQSIIAEAKSVARTAAGYAFKH